MELDAKVIAVGETEGIHLAFDKMERTPNTVDAHRLIWLADQHGCQDAVVEALFRAYFIEGKDIGNQQTLIDVAAESRLDRQSAENMLNSEAGMEVIVQAGELSQRHDVTGFRSSSSTIRSRCPVRSRQKSFRKRSGRRE